MTTDTEVFEIFAAHDAAIAQEYAEQAESDLMVLQQVRPLVTDEAFAQIEVTLGDAGGHRLEIVDKPVGEPEDEGFVLGDVFIDQTTEGGMDGDEFAGTVCMPLGDGRYLKYHYES